MSAAAARLGLADRVRLPGFTSAPHDALLDGSVFVLPSRYEGFGLALAEAMALGLPVIAADCPSGPAEIVRDGVTGLLVPSENVDALAAAMARLLEDAPLARRLGDAARQTRDRYSISAALAQWNDLLDDVTRGAS